MMDIKWGYIGRRNGRTIPWMTPYECRFHIVHLRTIFSRKEVKIQRSCKMWPKNTLSFVSNSKNYPLYWIWFFAVLHSGPKMVEKQIELAQNIFLQWPNSAQVYTAWKLIWGETVDFLESPKPLGWMDSVCCLGKSSKRYIFSAFPRPSYVFVWHWLCCESHCVILS